MRYRTLAVMMLGAAMSVAAQQTTPQAPPAGEKEVPTTAGEAQSQTPQQPGMAHPHQHRGGMKAGNKAEMHAEMAAHIEKMRSKVEQMRANAAKVKDANVRQALQLDADMWSQMVEHMQQMHARMQSGQGGMMGGGMMGHGKGMGHGEGKGGCCAGMKKPAEQGAAATGKEEMAAGMGGSGGMACGKGGGCCGGDGGGCCGGHGGEKSQQPTQ